ncbi:MAG: gliding motility-associated C-terminal domain-containing protein [Bacteroidota bacterium]|nr:gliding motility-associated C-terminal domain-containing protein [Bacteroidota bacterium]
MRFLLVILLLAQGFAAAGQKEACNWYMGERAGLSFCTGNAQVLHDGAGLHELAGAMTMSDSLGRLLFYSSQPNSGHHVMFLYNREHKKMPGSDDLQCPFTYYRVTAAPVPGSSRFYFVFYIGVVKTSWPRYHALFYAMVDMAGDGGRGEVVSKNNIVADRITEESFALIRHDNGRDYWLLARRANTDSFMSFPITGSGIGRTAVISRTGIKTGPNDQEAPITVSVSGTRIVYGTWYWKNMGVYVADFDKATGIVQNHLSLDIVPTKLNTALSPDGTKLYVRGLPEYAVYQYDLDAGSPEAIVQSRTGIIDTFGGAVCFDLALGPDGKIYISGSATYRDSYRNLKLSVIHYPNLKGEACGAEKFGIHLGNGSTRVLPTIPHWYLQPVADFSCRPACFGDSVSFTGIAPFGADMWQWDFGDGSLPSAEANPKHFYSAPGKYIVKLVVSRYGTIDTATREVEISPPPEMNLGGDKVICRGHSLTLAAPEAEEYFWSTGERTSTITVSAPGSYWLRVRKGGCLATDTVSVSWPEEPSPMKKTVSACFTTEPYLLLDAGEAVEYLWYPGGETTRKINVNSPGIYKVMTKDKYGCEYYDSTEVTEQCPPQLFIPNSFSPNGDGLNDSFSITTNFVTELNLSIYDRWGRLIYSSKDVNPLWDGSFRETMVPEGIYLYKIGLRGDDKTPQYHTGTITIIR